MKDIISPKVLDAMSMFKLRDVARKFNIDNPETISQDELKKLILKKDENKKSHEEKPMFTKEDLEKLTLAQLKIIAETEGIKAKKKDDIINALLELESKKLEEGNKEEIKQDIVDSVPEATVDLPIDAEEKVEEKADKKDEFETKIGVLDIHQDGYGFLRAENCEYGLKDAYISAKLIRSLGLRPGDFIQATAKKNNESNKPSGVVSVEAVNGKPTQSARFRPNFDTLVPIFPNERLTLETGKNSDFAIRCIDLIAPIGKGQRAMIVSPPKAGKTTLLKKVANAISNNYPEVELYVLLIDERPEEVTDMQRSIKGEVIYSTFDETPEHHCKAAELLIERAKRSVELGRDVVVIMDSLTRLARAYNLTIPPTGRTLSGGMDPGALHPPKKFFGSARNIENGGSLTIIATALVDTGSRMDDVIYEEFKGTGNMEIHLDRKLSERRIFPAIDLNKSSTRREDLLLTQKELQGAFAVRKMLSNGDTNDTTEQLINMIVNTESNDAFINIIMKKVELLEKEGFSFRKPTL